MTTTPPDPQDKPPREFWLCKGDPIDPLQCPDLHVYAKKPLWKFADDAIRVIEYSAYEAMREANELLRVDILKTVAMFQESEKDRWTARKENAELKENLARAEKERDEYKFMYEGLCK